MSYNQDLPFGGFRGFVRAIKEIVQTEFPKRQDIMGRLDHAKPSTTFGVYGLKMNQTEFRLLVEKLGYKTNLIIYEEDPGIRLGSLMGSVLAAYHVDQRNQLDVHLSAMERNQL